MSLLLGLMLLGASCVKSSSPAMADLRALDKDGSKKELVERLGLVNPSERDDEWFGIAQRGAAAYLGELKVEDGGGRAALEEADVLLERYPRLATSPSFMAARFELGLRAFRATHGDYRHSGGPNPWVAKMVEFIEKDTVTPNGPARLAREVVMTRLIPVTAFPLLQLALKRDATAACADDTFTPVIVEAAVDDVWHDENAKLLAGACASKLPAVKAAFHEKDRTRTVQIKLCKLLSNEPDMKDTCAALAPQ